MYGSSLLEIFRTVFELQCSKFATPLTVSIGQSILESSRSFSCFRDANTNFFNGLILGDTIRVFLSGLGNRRSERFVLAAGSDEFLAVIAPPPAEKPLSRIAPDSLPLAIRMRFDKLRDSIFRETLFAAIVPDADDQKHSELNDR